MSTRPLAFFDVDGVLNRDVSNSQAKKRRLLRRRAWADGQIFRLWLDPADTGRIARIGQHCDLAWGTTWEHHANGELSTLLGLSGDWPVAVTRIHEFTKAYGVQRIARGRPLVWVDDNFGLHEQAAFAGYMAPALRLDADPAIGLSDEHVEQIIEWAARSRACPRWSP